MDDDLEIGTGSSFSSSIDESPVGKLSYVQLF